MGVAAVATAAVVNAPASLGGGAVIVAAPTAVLNAARRTLRAHAGTIAAIAAAVFVAPALLRTRAIGVTAPGAILQTPALLGTRASRVAAPTAVVRTPIRFAVGAGSVPAVPGAIRRAGARRLGRRTHLVATTWLELTISRTVDATLDGRADGVTAIATIERTTQGSLRVAADPVVTVPAVFIARRWVLAAIAGSIATDNRRTAILDAGIVLVRTAHTIAAVITIVRTTENALAGRARAVAALGWAIDAATVHTLAAFADSIAASGAIRRAVGRRLARIALTVAAVACQAVTQTTERSLRTGTATVAAPIAVVATPANFVGCTSAVATPSAAISSAGQRGLTKGAPTVPTEPGGPAVFAAADLTLRGGAHSVAAIAAVFGAIVEALQSPADTVVAVAAI